MTYTSDLIFNVSGSILAGIAIFLLREIWWVLSGLFLGFFGNLTNVAGSNWTATYEEPDAAGTLQTVTEEITLRQFGHLVRGSGIGKATGDRNFVVKGHIRRNIFVGSYSISGSRKTKGSGSFQLFVEGNERNMLGWCMWHDADTDRVEGSTYRWTRPE